VQDRTTEKEKENEGNAIKQIIELTKMKERERKTY
jgi:hypothetical protein